MKRSTSGGADLKERDGLSEVADVLRTAPWSSGGDKLKDKKKVIVLAQNDIFMLL